MTAIYDRARDLWFDITGETVTLGRIRVDAKTPEGTSVLFYGPIGA
jgi:hypothetical protein